MMLLQLVINGIIAGSIYALIALGFTVIYRTVKFFHFAHGIIYTIGAYAAYSFVKSLQINFWISSVAAIALVALVGVGIDRLVYYPLRLRKAPNLVLLIASFGVYIFLQNLLILIYGNETLVLRITPIQEGYKIGPASITSIQLIILITSIILMAILWLFMQRTRLGKAMRAVADDPLGANIVGVNPEWIIIVSFVIGSCLAGSAAILISLETNIEPAMGFSALLKGIIASIVGGIGSIPGATLGGFFVGLVENVGIWKIPSAWKDSISFIVLIIFLLAKPTGLLIKKPQEEVI
jgi:branched-chain amino acid transport system permease protein